MSFWSSWFGKAAEADDFPSLPLCRTISFVRWKVVLVLLKHWPSLWQLASSQGVCIPYARCANLGSYHYLFIEWPSLILLSAQNILVISIVNKECFFRPHVSLEFPLQFVGSDLIALLIFGLLVNLICSFFLSLVLDFELLERGIGIFIHLCNSTQCFCVNRNNKMCNESKFGLLKFYFPVIQQILNLF